MSTEEPIKGPEDEKVEEVPQPVPDASDHPVAEPAPVVKAEVDDFIERLRRTFTVKSNPSGWGGG